MIRIDHLFTEQYQNIPLRALLLEQLDIPHLHGAESSDDEAKAGGNKEEFLTRVVQTQWRETVEELELESKDLTRENEIEPDETTTEQHCYVSRRQRVPTNAMGQPIQPIPQQVLDASTVIVSCGMKNFESTVYTDGKQQKFRTHLGKRTVDADHFRKPKKEYRDDAEIFSKSFKDNYPTLCQGRDIYIIDCTGFDSPEHDLRLRSHTGNHPTILKSIVESQKFTIINTVVRELKPFRKNLVINVCTS